MPPVRKIKPAKAAKKESIVPKDESPAAAASKTVVSGQLDKKLKKQQQKQQEKKPERGVVFIKHLPHGFFEEQLQKYFQQFGNVTRLRLARSKRTGGSKNFAFVEFEYPEVAQVAAETMQNYLMFKKVVKTAYIPPEKQRFNYFKTSLKKVKNKAGKTIYVSNKTAAIQRKVKQHNDWSDEVYQKRTASALNKARKLNAKYAHLGIDFSSIIVAPKKLTAEEKAERVAAETQKKELDAVAGSSKAKGAKGSKRQQTATTTDVAAAQKQPNKAKKSKTVGLEELLGNTLNDDSEDEDYIAMPESDADEDASDDGEDDDAATSDEESYGFINESDKDKEDGDKSSEDEAEAAPAKSVKNTKAYSKSAKQSKVDRFEQLIKRKPHVGGVQKLSKKPLKKTPAATKGKIALQVAAAKEVAKPLQSVKNKKHPKAAKTGKKQKV